MSCDVEAGHEVQRYVVMVKQVVMLKQVMRCRGIVRCVFKEVLRYVVMLQ